MEEKRGEDEKDGINIAWQVLLLGISKGFPPPPPYMHPADTLCTHTYSAGLLSPVQHCVTLSLLNPEGESEGKKAQSSLRCRSGL